MANKKMLFPDWKSIAKLLKDVVRECTLYDTERILKAVQNSVEWSGDLPGHLTKNAADGALTARPVLSRVAGASRSWMTKGLDQVASGETRGFELVACAARCHLWAIRCDIETRQVLRGKSIIGEYFRYPALNILLQFMLASIGVGQTAHLEWLTERLQENLQSKPKECWDLTAFEQFALQVVCTSRGVALPKTVIEWPDSAVYKNALNRPIPPEALKSVCDYHVAQGTQHNDDQILAFVVPPLNVYPVEVHALWMLHRERGFKWPELHHPLLNTPLTKFPEKVAMGEPHEAVTEAVAKCRELVPSLPEL